MDLHMASQNNNNQFYQPMLVQEYLATHELDSVKTCVELLLSFDYNIATKLSLSTAYKQIYIFIVINSTSFFREGHVWTFSD